jgi:hypothetical protein
MINYKTSIQELYDIFPLDTDDKYEELYHKLYKVTYYVVGKMYDHVESYDSRIISHDVAARIVMRFKTESTYHINCWPTVIKLYIKEQYREQFPRGLVLVGASKHDEDTEAIFHNNSIQYDMDSFIDMKSSTSNSFKIVKQVMDKLPFKMESQRAIIERAIIMSVTTGESFLNVLDEKSRRTAQAYAGMIRTILRNNKENGLISSRKL